MPKPNPKVLSFLLPLAIFLPILGILLIVFHLYNFKYIDAEQKIMQSHSRQVTEYLEYQLKELMVISDTLSVFLLQKQGDYQSMDAIANYLLAEHPSVRTIALAPDAIIKKIYPIESNEGLLGTHLADLPERADIINLAQHSQSLMIFGPQELASGYWGLQVYQPIFFANNEFWGFITLTIRLPELFKTADIENRLGKNYLYRLSRYSSEKNQLITFANSPGVDSLPAAQVFSLETYGPWKLEVASSIAHPPDRFGQVVSVLLSLILTYLLLKLKSFYHNIRIIEKYDSALGYQDRFQILLKADLSLSAMLANQGYSVVIVISTDVLRHDLHGLDRFHSLILDSLRTNDLIVPLDDVRLMVLISQLNSKDVAKNIAEKLFNILLDYKQSQENIDFPLKMGAYLRSGHDTNDFALTEALKALRIANARQDDALEIINIKR